MGILRKITDEYFGDSMRSEDYVKFNTDEMKPVDMGGSVLWADRDLEVKSGGGWIYYDKYFTYDEISGVEFDDGWRIPTFDEFTELYRVIRKENSQRSPYKKISVSFIGNKEKLEFKTKGYYLNQFPDKLMHDEWSFYRMTTDTDESGLSIEVFNCNYSKKYVIMIIKDRKNNSCYFGKENVHIPIRLVKDK